MSRVASKSRDTGFPNRESLNTVMTSPISGIHGILSYAPGAFIRQEARNLNS